MEKPKENPAHGSLLMVNSPSHGIFSSVVWLTVVVGVGVGGDVVGFSERNEKHNHPPTNPK